MVIQASTDPNIIIGETVASYPVPAAVGGTVNIRLDSPYTGPAQVVWIGPGQYLIESIPVTPTTQITLQNINDPYVPTKTIVAGAQLISLPELPAGRVGAYGMGRVWESLTDGIQFIAGDIVGGSSGTQFYNGRDAVLRVTENSYLAGGGTFHVPGL